MVEAKKSAKKAQKNMQAHVKNAAEVARGKVKTAAGKATGNKKVEVKGRLDQVKGKAKQAGQRIKEAVED
jgi:uncharacterized protein YjbJ (UPF0337 family)